MQLNQGARIFTAEGKEVGRLDRVVIDPKTNEITDIVIHQGLLFSTDKVIGVDLIADSEGERIVLRLHENELADLLNFEETHYIQSSGSPLSGTQISGPIGIALPGLYAYPPHVDLNYTKQVRQNIPEETVAVKEGAKVIARDGQVLGHVAQVLTRSGEDYVTHIVIAISTGLLSQEKKMIPIGWIDRLGQNEVHLVVEASFVEKLPTFEYA